MLTRSSPIRSNLLVVACWVIYKIDCTWSSSWRDIPRSSYLTCDYPGRVSWLVHHMVWMHRAAQEAHLSLEDRWSNLFGPQYNCPRGVYLWMGSRLVYLFHPKGAHAKVTPDVCHSTGVRGYCTGLQYDKQMGQSAYKLTVLFLLQPGSRRPPEESEARMRQRGDGSSAEMQ